MKRLGGIIGTGDLRLQCTRCQRRRIVTLEVIDRLEGLVRSQHLPSTVEARCPRCEMDLEHFVDLECKETN